MNVIAICISMPTDQGRNLKRRQAHQLELDEHNLQPFLPCHMQAFGKRKGCVENFLPGRQLFELEPSGTLRRED
ncbi:hypothetical protein BMI86_05840 [Thioclava sp. DLFJ5-1]|nr:hypothetical protein BMI86_05840 [Thioclava sp. DLFJ5-1]